LNSILKLRSFWVIAVVVMIAAIMVHWVVLVQLKVPTLISHFSSGIYGITLVTFAVLIANNLYYYRPQKLNYYFLIVWCFTYALIGTFLVDFVLRKIWANNTALINALSIIQFFKFGFSFIVLFCIAITCVLWYTFEDLRVDSQRQSQMLMLNKEAELNKLRLQLQPHFLFNSLNSINALVGSKPAEARKMIQQLSDFLRFTVKREENQHISLADELQHLQLYLDIEKVRFGHRLDFELTTTEACKTMQIPALMLQPVLENAIKFGLYDTTGIVSIQILAQIVDHSLQVEISNPFDSQTQTASQGTGFGLNAIRKRLELLYGRYDLLQTSQENNVFTTKITLPQTKND
jgi:two-component system, LytTR family, sensor kinase